RPGRRPAPPDPRRPAEHLHDLPRRHGRREGVRRRPLPRRPPARPRPRGRGVLDRPDRAPQPAPGQGHIRLHQVVRVTQARAPTAPFEIESPRGRFRLAGALILRGAAARPDYWTAPIVGRIPLGRTTPRASVAGTAEELTPAAKSGLPCSGAIVSRVE